MDVFSIFFSIFPTLISKKYTNIISWGLRRQIKYDMSILEQYTYASGQK